MAHDNQRKPKPWEPNGPSPNPKGRPPTKHLKALVAFIDPQAGDFIEFDRTGTGAFNANGKEMSHGDVYMHNLWKQSLTDAKARELYDQKRKEAYEKEAKYKFGVLDGAGFHRHHYMEEFITRERKGRRRLNVWPDPRDIIFHGNGDISIVGPMDAEQEFQLQRMLKLRDGHLAFIDELMTWDCLSLAERKSLYLGVRRRIYRMNRKTPPRLRKPVPVFRDLFAE
jgi:hypothetical protein